MENKYSYVYILTNQNNKVMYVGVTSDLVKRMQEHVSGKYLGFTARYNVHKLVKYEVYTDIRDAIARESQLKNWKRKWKNELVSKTNPKWNDLNKELHGYNPVA
ncbi:MAG: GIY-YIG nuclease family protein [Fibrobacter sp.]|nr:GIY-YIG nuclease family protein [Fibrobacter sp.]